MVPELRADLRALARRRDQSLSQLLRSLIARELGEETASSGSRPDESAIREMAILLAVEYGIKLLEATAAGEIAHPERLGI